MGSLRATICGQRRTGRNLLVGANIELARSSNAAMAVKIDRSPVLAVPASGRDSGRDEGRGARLRNGHAAQPERPLDAGSLPQEVDGPLSHSSETGVGSLRQSPDETSSSCRTIPPLDEEASITTDRTPFVDVGIRSPKWVITGITADSADQLRSNQPVGGTAADQGSNVYSAISDAFVEKRPTDGTLQSLLDCPRDSRKIDVATFLGTRCSSASSS